MPLVRLDFYRVYLPENHQGTLEDLFAQILGLPPDQRIQEVSGGWVSLHEITRAAGFVRGIILRAKSDEIPPAADRTGALQDLLLNPDQGIAGLTHFLYRSSNRVLLLQRNAQGVRAPGFENYVKDITQVAVEFRPILQRETIERLRRLRMIRKVGIKLANPQGLVHYQLGSSVERLIRLMNDYEAPVAELTLHMGYRRGSLNLRGTVALLERLLRVRERSDDVKRIVVYGKEQEEERTLFLDLLVDKIIESADIRVGENRRLSDQACSRALEEAYARRREELEQLFGE